MYFSVTLESSTAKAVQNSTENPVLAFQEIILSEVTVTAVVTSTLSTWNSSKVFLVKQVFHHCRL